MQIRLATFKTPPLAHPRSSSSSSSKLNILSQAAE
jgi:hypothetical protein